MAPAENQYAHKSSSKNRKNGSTKEAMFDKLKAS